MKLKARNEVEHSQGNPLDLALLSGLTLWFLLSMCRGDILQMSQRGNVVEQPEAGSRALDIFGYEAGPFLF